MLFPIQFLFIAYFAGNGLFQLFSQNQIFIFAALSGFCCCFFLSISKNFKGRLAMVLCLFVGFGFAAWHQSELPQPTTPYRHVKADNQVSGPYVWQQFQKLSFAVRDYLLPFPQKALPQPYSQVLNSLIFGNSAAPLEREVQEKYRKAGVIHLLVVSGSQIALLVGTILQLTQILKIPAWPSFVIVTIFNVGFTIATGADPSILRACIMAEIVQLQNLWGAPKNSTTLLLLTAFILSLMDPQIIWQISFQLSFAATVGLIFISPVFKEKLRDYFPAWFADLLGTTLGPILITTPICLYYFSGFSIVSLPLNLILPMIVEIIVLLGFLATVIAVLFYPLAYLIYQFLLILIWGIHQTVLFCSGWQYAYVNIVSPTLAMLSLYALVSLLLILALKKHNWFYQIMKKPLWLMSIVVMLFAWHQVLLLAEPAQNTLRVNMISVGQGESILIQTPQNKNILIDAGNAFGKHNAGKKFVLPYLRKKGINTLDLVILTHPHLDHYGGLLSVLQEIPTQQLLDPGYPSQSMQYQALLNWFKKTNTPYRSVKSGETIAIDETVSINILMPPQPFLHGAHSDANENSVVIMLHYQKFVGIFTGDAGAQAEQVIMDTVPTIDITLLKVGHHGSRYSSTSGFLKKYTPDVALISCGKNNRYQHPHLETLEKLKAMNIQTYRTDLVGNIELWSDGQEYHVEAQKTLSN
jgi:competence protein ComEC